MTRTVDPFEAFVRRFQDMVYATALRLLGRPEDAEDVAQTVFLKALERFDRIGESPAAAGWLRTVTTNLCLNHLTRHRARWRLFSEMEEGERVGDRPGFGGSVAPEEVGHRESAGAAQAGGPAETDEAQDRSRRLESALLRLPDHQRIPIVLYHFEERSYQEIAEALGVSLGKVKTDIHRGREALKRCVRDEP